MKTKLLIGAALLFSAASFAQSPKAAKQDRNKENHGTNVSAVARTEAEAGTKGDAVSAAASAKAQASVNRQNPTAEERAERKAARKAAHEAKREEQEEFVADVKARADAREEDISADMKAEIEARKAALKESKEEAKAARAAAKAERKSSDDDLLDADAKVKVGKADKKSAKPSRPAKIKGGAGVNTDVQLHRPKVGAKARGTAGLGIL
jgi:hypothetical protein